MGKVQQVRAILADPFVKFEDLSKDERRVLRLASRGFTNREIGEKLDMTDELVGYWLRNARLKIGLSKSELPNFVFRQIEAVVG
jgi:DNA-binding NarL/FixJ family response regulator